MPSAKSTMAEPSLFDDPDAEPVPAPRPAVKLSPDQRRTIRQKQAIANGVHPLALVFRGIQIHPDAPRPTGPEQKDLPGPRCGTCAFRGVFKHRDRSYGKCAFGEYDEVRKGYQGQPWTATVYPRQSHGAGTDVRSFWPGCSDYVAAE